jgi:hypothetical protein
VIALIDYWSDFPPLHMLARSALGVFGVRLKSPDKTMAARPRSRKRSREEILQDAARGTATFDMLPLTVQSFIKDVENGRVQ